MTDIILALDVSTLADAERLIAATRSHIRFYKVGLQLFMAQGARAVELVKKHGGDVFLDLKLHDIPQTVAHAVREAGQLGVHSVSFHLAGGRAMVEAAAAMTSRPRLWGVSVLTSMTNEDLSILGGRTTAELVPDLARLGMSSGMDGLVCSGQELPLVNVLKPRPTLVVPGVRGPGDAVGDQKRVISPRDAVKAGADFIVVGRPITQAADAAAAAAAIAADIAAA